MQEKTIDMEAMLEDEIPLEPLDLERMEGIGQALVELKEILKKTMIECGVLSKENEREPNVISSTEEEKVNHEITFQDEKILFVVARKQLLQALEDYPNHHIEVILTGGPLHAKYYKKMNPNLPDHAMANIEKKIAKIIKKIRNKSQDKEIVVIITEQGEMVDGFLANSRGLIQEETGKSTKIMHISSMKDITTGAFTSSINEMGDP